MSLSAACDEARAIFIDNPGANQFEPGLSRSEARKRLFDTLEWYFFTNHKIVKIAVNMNFETKFTAKYGKYILMRNCFLWGKYYSVYFGTGREVCGNCTEPYGFWRIGYYS